MKGKRILYLQIIGGISGDMFLGLMADLGADLKELETIFSKHLPVKISYQKRRTKGFSGTMLHIDYNKDQSFRNLSSLRSIIDKLDIDVSIKEKSIDALYRLAQVEAEVHGIGIEDVCFHEIGAVDTVVDVVGSFWCIHKLSISEVYCSEVPLFEGFVHCEHGKIPLPAPATLKLLKGKPVYFVDEKKELITPTGALILDSIVDSFLKRPKGKLIGEGIGIGHMDMSIPNMVRGLFILDQDDKIEDFIEEDIYVLETNVDHITGEEIGYIFDTILKQGALDVFFIPGVMKKNRPSGMLKVMCYENKLKQVLNFMFKSTMTLGIRINKTKRVKLDRSTANVHTKFGDIAFKEFKFQGKRFKRPEFDFIKEICEKIDVSPVEFRLKIMEKGINDL